jgi:hypothetical protein
MDTTERYRHMGRRVAAHRRTGERSADFLKYSKEVLAVLKDDIECGVKVDPVLITSIEKTISKHEAGGDQPHDLTKRIDAIKDFGRGRQN